MSLSRKLLLLFVTVAIVTASVLALVVFLSARDAVRAEIAKSQHEAGRVLSDRIDQTLYKAMLDARQIAAEDEVIETTVRGATPVLSEAIDRQALLSGPFDLILITDRAGVVRAATDRRRIGTPVSTDAAEQQVLRRALAGSNAYSDLVRLPDARRPTVVFGVPVREDFGRGQVIGALLARYSWTAILEILDDSDSVNRVRVVNARGQLIAAATRDFEKNAFANLGGHALLQKGSTPRSLVDFRASDGTAMVGTVHLQQGYLSYKGSGWKTVVESPASLVNAPVNRLARRVILAVVLITVLSALLFAAIARRLTAPIRSLTDVATAIGEGDFSARAEVTTRDEVGRLANTFNDMVSAIEHVIAQRRESEHFLDSVVQNIPMGIFVKDATDLRYVRVNQAGALMFGKSPNELIGLTTSDLLPPQQAATIFEQDRSVRSHRHIDLRRDEIDTLAGPRLLHTQRLGIDGPDGSVRYILSIAEDVTDVVVAEERNALRLSIAQILSQATELDAAFNPLLDALLSSLRWDLGFLWLAREQGDVLEVVASSGAHGSLELMEQANRSRHPVRGECLSGEVWGEGAPLWIADLQNDPRYMLAPQAAASGLWSAFAVPIALGTEILGVIELLSRQRRPENALLMSYVEELGVQLAQFIVRSRAEENLRRAKIAAEEANRAKSDFLARMSHEIRTPLNGIVGMTALLARTPLTREQQEFVKIVRGSSSLLLSVINDILDFSKIEAGKLTLDSAPFSLREVVGEAVKPLALRAEEAGVEVVTAIEPAVPDALVGDPMRLRQILVNLVGNAVKFTSSGEIVVSAEVEDALDDGFLMHFTVADTGLGIPAAKLAAVFHAFEQADVSTTRRFGGTGLGLSITTRLVEIMGGRVWVESIEGKGSTFHFTVRLGRGEEARTPAAELRLAGLRVLVVDDNATNRRVLMAMLESWRMQATAVSHGSEAIARLSQEKWDLVLLDANMPEIDGFQVAESLRARGSASVTIMMLTSSSQPSDAARCRELGIASYLTKPVTQSDLLDAMARVTAGERLSAESERAVTRPSSAAEHRGMRILLAEDNAVNQTVARTILEQEGYEVVVAETGGEAVVLAGKEDAPVDLILMDLQMPELGGLDATRIIREREALTGAHVPIIALTAHAMREDRERCLAAGMDDYLAKPLDRDELLDAIHRLLAGTPSSIRRVTPEQAFDPTLLSRKYAANPGLLKKIIGVFERSLPQHLEKLQSALQNEDAEALERAAHSLKGSVGTFQARRAYELAHQLESLGRRGTVDDASALLHALKLEIVTMLEALGTLSTTPDAMPGT